MSQNTVNTVSPAELARVFKNPNAAELIDVRTPVEYREAHVSFARNLPLDRLDPAAFIRGRGENSEATLYVVCQSGTRSRMACEKFLAAGLRNVMSVEGGTPACAAAGLPMTRGKKAISLERQVRIAAGSLVLLGVGLGYFWNEYFLGLAAFVGAGLVFAGLTDTCGMGMLLARMPWNRCDTGATCCAAANPPN